MQRLFLATHHQDEEIVESALHVIREVMTQEYEVMQFYFNEICEATARCASHSTNKVGATAFEFWTTLVEDETERTEKNAPCLQYIYRCKENLIGLII